MKKIHYKIIGSFFVLMFCLVFNNTFNFQKTIRNNINLSYLSYIYQGDIYNFFSTSQVSESEHITVKDYRYNEDALIINYLSDKMYSPLEGIIVKKGILRNERYIILQTNNSEYIISGFKEINARLYQRIRINDVIGTINNNDEKFVITIVNTKNSSFADVCSLYKNYEEI